VKLAKAITRSGDGQTPESTRSEIKGPGG